MKKRQFDIHKNRATKPKTVSSSSGQYKLKDVAVFINNEASSNGLITKAIKNQMEYKREDKVLIIPQKEPAEKKEAFVTKVIRTPNKKKAKAIASVQHKNLQIPLTMHNIDFFDGYYEVFITKGGVKDKYVKSKKYTSIYSSSQLQLVKKRLIERVAKGIYIIFNTKEVYGLSKPLDLDKYIGLIKRGDSEFVNFKHIGVNGRRSLADCIKNTKSISFYKKTYKSDYLDSLFPLLGDEKLILAYEDNHGKEEDAFIIPIPLSKGRYAIVFENVSAESSTTSEVFIADKSKYKDCLQCVFDYFTDIDILNKREIIRRKRRDPREFQSLKYYYVDHDDFEVWHRGIMRIIRFLS